jgi:hypothetical protein
LLQTYGQAEPELCQAPVLSQVCGCWPLHRVAPGVHTPVHEPDTHAWLVHADAVPHCPCELQVWTPLPEHLTAPGVHTPEQAPEMHAWLEHVTGLPHWPLLLQVWTPLPEH